MHIPSHCTAGHHLKVSHAGCSREERSIRRAVSRMIINNKNQKKARQNTIGKRNASESTMSMGHAGPGDHNGQIILLVTGDFVARPCDGP